MLRAMLRPRCTASPCSLASQPACQMTPCWHLTASCLLRRCSNAETLLVQQGGSRSDTAGLLLDYYLFNQGGTLSQVANKATGVNFDSMEAQLNSTVSSAVSVRCLPWGVRFKLQIGLCARLQASLQTGPMEA